MNLDPLWRAFCHYMEILQSATGVVPLGQLHLCEGMNVPFLWGGAGSCKVSSQQPFWCRDRSGATDSSRFSMKISEIRIPRVVLLTLNFQSIVVSDFQKGHMYTIIFFVPHYILFLMSIQLVPWAWMPIMSPTNMLVHHVRSSNNSFSP